MEKDREKTNPSTKNPLKKESPPHKKENEVIRSIGHSENLLKTITSLEDFDEIQKAIELFQKIVDEYKRKRKEEAEKSKKRKTPPDDLLDIEEIKAITKESKQTIYRRIREGEIKSVKLSKNKNRQIRVWRSVLMRYLDEKKFDL